MSKNEIPSNCTTHRFISFDKTPIFYRKQLSVSTPKAILVLTHGMGEHSGRYQEFCNFLSENGVVTFRPDLRGFGESGGKRGCIKSYHDFQKDLAVIIRLARDHNRDLPFFLMGHSFGGLLTTSLLAEKLVDSPNGLILTSPIFGMAIQVPKWRSLLAYIATVVAPDYTQHNRVNRKFLSHDVNIHQFTHLDPLMHQRISARLYTELLKTMKQVRTHVKNISCPVLIVQADDDRVVSKRVTTEIYDLMNAPDKTLKIVKDAYHEVLNELDRLETYKTITNWLFNRSKIN